MYCIISLPRTSSTYTYNILYSGVMMKNPLAVTTPLSSHFSAFNPRYMSPEKIEIKLEKILKCDPLPVIKIISNHDFSIVDKIIESKYITVFIEPQNLRKQVLKVLVAKKTDTFVNKEERRKYIGTVVIQSPDVLERFQYYTEHMKFKERCDYHFTDDFIIKNSTQVQNILELPSMPVKKQYVPFDISDEEMLVDVNEFNDLYDKLSMEYFGVIK